MPETNSNIPEGAAAEDPAFDELVSNDGFQDMVVRAAEQMILSAPLDDLIRFAFGSREAARAAWTQKQRSRFRRPRQRRRAAA